MGDLGSVRGMQGPRQYRKKPLVIEAMQWDGTADNASRIIDWILSLNGTARYGCETPEVEPTEETEHVCVDPFLSIDTLEGTITASPDDYIIRGIQSEFYPCRGDIFLDSYEPV